MELLLAIFLNFPVISINTAPLDSIKMLPIGYTDARKISQEMKIPLDSVLATFHVPPEKAESIYAYREIHGPFDSYYEIGKVPGVNPGDLKRWKKYVVVYRMRPGRDFSYYAERVRERGAAEESPTEYAMDQWISFLSNPINVNKATVDELYALDRVSLIDAAAVVSWAHKLRIRHQGDLRRVPGLSYYGYRNMRDFVVYSDLKPRPLSGWFYSYTSLPNEMYVGSSELSERISELTDTTRDSTLYSALLASGWTQAQVDSLVQRLRSERQDVYQRTLFPYMKVKTSFYSFSKAQGGILYEINPYRRNFIGDDNRRHIEDITKFYIGMVNVGPLKRLYVGNYHIALGQGLLMDNTDDARSRSIWRPQGLYGDISSTDEFALRGIAGDFRLKWFDLMGFLSKAPRNGVPDRFGRPIFYYAGNFVPQAYEFIFDETVYGGSFKINPPHPFPIGTQFGINFMKISRDVPMSFAFADLDIPGDADSLKGDASFPEPDSARGRAQQFVSFEARTVIMPMSFEFEYAKELGHGSALVARTRLQKNTFYVDVLLRHYEPDYLNPYARPFYEDTRFRDTPLEKPYRLTDPIASGLVDLPIPKPETGIYVETRFQPVRNVIFPRVYIDTWRDNTDGLWNYRFQGEIEYRPVYALRFRLKQKIQLRHNFNKFGVSESRTLETTLRSFVVLSGTDFIGLELRYGRVILSPRPTYRDADIDGGFVALTWSHNFSRKLQFKSGAAIWTTNGMSQWIFEDTGIDFLYGDGKKFYISFLERLSPNMGMKLKFRIKNTDYRHVGLYQNPVYDPDGRPIYNFVENEPFYSVSASFYYNF